MRRELNIWVVGGDMRQTKLAELLADDGHTVHTYALDKGLDEGMRGERDLSGAALADCVVLPLPASGEGGALNTPLAEEKTRMETVFAALRPGQVVCAGKVDHDLTELGKAQGVLLFDYFAREELAVANAVPVALAV